MSNLDLSAFQPARLIPVTGIKGALDQERRAASALLAVMQGVPELTIALLKDYGAIKGTVETYIEPEFKLGTKKVRPDGLIRITKGQKSWTALVEFKTGKNDLEIEQINQYLDIAKEHGFDALLTISNEVLDATGTHPTAGIDNRRLRSTSLIHLSWMEVITECIILSAHTGVQDSDRDWILKELIRFLQSDASGASEFNDMGPNWVTVRESIRDGSLKKPDDAALDIVSKFQNLMRYCAFTIAARSGVNATVVTSKSASADGRKFMLTEAQKLINDKQLSGVIKIPGAAADIHVIADIASGVTHCFFEISAPGDGRNKSRLNWLLRQYKEVPKEAKVLFSYKRARAFEAPLNLAPLKSGEIEAELDNSKELTSFKIDLVMTSGSKRGRGQGAFIDSVLDQMQICYGELLQPIKPWVAAAPKLSNKVVEIIPEVQTESEAP